jgi:predicted RNA binding protein YcfA (HicA-like mRNA interferase family)
VLRVFGYRVSRQTGSHMRLTTHERGEHHLTIPSHAALRVGTLTSILGDVGAHFEMTRDAVVKKLFDKE